MLEHVQSLAFRDGGAIGGPAYATLGRQRRALHVAARAASWPSSLHGVWAPAGAPAGVSGLPRLTPGRPGTAGGCRHAVGADSRLVVLRPSDV